MLWGSAFNQPPDELFARLNSSFRFDRRLWNVDIRGSVAYAHALQRAGLLVEQEAHALEAGLGRVREEFAKGEFRAVPDDEDIHTAVERRLSELIGEPAGKLHTGRSRNDQVATDLRLYVREAIDRLRAQVRDLQSGLVEQAEALRDSVMPGYTHLRRAQPILASHYILSFFWMLERDLERLLQTRDRAGVLPLGSGALAGSPFPIDRAALARELGLERVSENSIDAVSDRDFVVELLFDLALLQTHLSRLAEDLILYLSAEFGFFMLADSYSTGSSLMPQKKNPDSLELVRGKTGRVVGDLVALLVVLKGLPSTYDKDLQEDKEPLFDAVDTLDLVLPVVSGVIRTLSADPVRMRAALDESMLATDLADHLVLRGLPFREAHRLVGALVKRAQEKRCALSALEDGEVNQLSDRFGTDWRSALDYDRSVARRAVQGGTAPDAVREQLGKARRLLEESAQAGE